jgi:hypothetical protein
LPNRLYEASRHGAVPIALAGVETGRYLAERGFGVRLADAAELEARLERLTPESYAELRRALARIPAEVFAAGPEDCRRLVDNLAGERLDAPISPLPQHYARNGVSRQEHIHGAAV